MAIVTVTKSMSLDGFVAGSNISHTHALGEGGERLHDWLFHRNVRRGVTATGHRPADEVNARIVQATTAATGAVILGNRIFTTGLDHWGDVPYPVPSFVLTHTVREPMVMSSGTFTFVTDGIHSALRQAQAAAGVKKVMLMGASVVQQFLEAGLLDEIEINLVPVLLGLGLRLFEHFGAARIELEPVRVVETPEVTHLTYRVIQDARAQHMSNTRTTSR
jgi:dihydrofolate reductase